MDQQEWNTLLDFFRELRRWREEAEMMEAAEGAEQAQAVSGHLH